MIIGPAINKRDNHNHSNPKSLPDPSVKPPPINNQARGTGFALVKARNQSTVHPSNKIKLISSPTKKRIKPWNKQHLEIHLNTTKHVDIAQFQLSLKKGSVNSSAGNDDVPSTVASSSSKVICCVGASGIVSGTMNIGYLGIMPVRKRKKPKISDSMTKPQPEKVKKDEPKKVETIQKEAANVLEATNTIPIKDSNETIEATNIIETVLSNTDSKTKELNPNEFQQLAISTETVTETLTATSATATSIEPSLSIASIDIIKSPSSTLQPPNRPEQPEESTAPESQINLSTFKFVIGLQRTSKTGTTLRHNYITTTTTTTTEDTNERQRLTLVDLGSNFAVEINLSNNHAKSGETIVLNVLCRKATKKEIEKEDATAAILRNMNGTRHSSLHACIVRGRAAFVEQKLLERASAKLLRLKVSHPNEEKLKKALQWSNVTQGNGETILERQCDIHGCNVGCPIEGAVMNIDNNAVVAALGLLSPSVIKALGSDVVLDDKWLFEKIAQAAKRGGGQTGGVWFTGRHVMFSNPNRNQSPIALRSFLERLNCDTCANAMDALVTYVELKYSKSVSAVQINLHLDGNSCHKQHHDIYSIKQREKAGRDCTCSFKNNVATACFSLGSSRRVKLNAQKGGGENKKSKKCCEECVGVSKKPWLHSGDLMYFNDTWNRAWTHGIPKHDIEIDGEIGPRISIALLCAEADPKETLARLSKIGNVSIGTINIPGFETCSLTQ